MELLPPSLVWKNGTPVSSAYDDTYYSREDGLAESRYIFLDKNNIPTRLKSASHFTIAETGFGTGLNFLALWQLWEALPSPRPKLHYITTEKHPLTLDLIREAQQAWPELSGYVAQLTAALPPAIKGAHRRWLAQGNITIDFLYGDAEEMLTKYHTQRAVDAWFLDGFSPAKNPDIWTPTLFLAMAKLSGPETTLATFTAASAVHTGLSEVGFSVEKTSGFGHKRNMVIGAYTPQNATNSFECKNTKTHTRYKVIGAGIAGCMAAWRMAKLGHSVELHERTAHICSGASGNPAAAFTPYYPATWNTRGRLLASGFWTTHHIIHYLREQGHSVRGDFCGTLMLDMQDGSRRSKRLADWQNSLQLPENIRQKVTAAHASNLAHVALDHGGWFYPHGGWFHMGDLCAALLDDAGDAITLHLNSSHQDTDKHTLIATAHEAVKFSPEHALQKVHGQSIAFRCDNAWKNLRCVINAGHTLIPLGDKKLQWGATFRHHVETSEIFAEDTELLLADLAAAFPSLSPSEIEPWAGLRCTHRSRLPLIGCNEKNIRLHVAHGARGLLSACVEFEPQLFEL